MHLNGSRAGPLKQRKVRLNQSSCSYIWSDLALTATSVVGSLCAVKWKESDGFLSSDLRRREPGAFLARSGSAARSWSLRGTSAVDAGREIGSSVFKRSKAASRRGGDEPPKMRKISFFNR
jgi:hypothetical protein